MRETLKPPKGDREDGMQHGKTGKSLPPEGKGGAQRRMRGRNSQLIDQHISREIQ
jgi:hypothetical protein